MLVTIVSLKGAPGVTTFAHALAAYWPQPVRRILMEADPSGGDLAARFALAPTPGLVSLAAARDDASLWRHTQTLPDGLAAVPGPAGADQARAALRALMSHPDPADPDRAGVLPVEADAVALVDCGRIGPGSPAMGLVEAADVMLLLSRAAAGDLIHVAASLPRIVERTRRPVLLLVGNGYTSSEVARELGIPVMARIPHDPRGATRLGHRRGRTRHALARAARGVAETLASALAPSHRPASGLDVSSGTAPW